MKRFFGIQEEKEVKPSITLDEGVQMLDQRSQHLDAKIRGIEQEIIKQRDIMNKTRNPSQQNMAKQRALRLMKQKKMYEAQRDQMMTQAFNMEQASFTTQTMQDTMLQVSAMRAANQTMKAQFQEFSMDDIEDLQDELQEMFDQSNEIQEIMSRSYEMPFDLDEADLEQELQDLVLDDVDGEEIPSYLSETDFGLPTLDPLPTVPQHMATVVPNASSTQGQ
eukprot:TRINITY_DN10536_c0_g1_i1.p1 TRINITY_DN10536_c0_g1~~TRINITY_DN10536_c0_g1_i1.p1  ORF type:complete len:229 (+),score=49.83 TRINITY_DN10536_c0_g1_i1:27-689(+)